MNMQEAKSPLTVRDGNYKNMEVFTGKIPVHFTDFNLMEECEYNHRLHFYTRTET